MKKLIIILTSIVLLLLVYFINAVYQNERKALREANKSSAISPALSNVLLTDLVQNDQAGTAQIIEKLVAMGADKKTLRFVVNNSMNYLRDVNSVYWTLGKIRKIEDVDPNSFTIIDRTGNTIARDNYHVFITGDLVQDADPATFNTMAGGGYFHDEKKVFYQEVVDTQNDYRYRLREVIGADPKTIRTFPYLTSNVLAADDVHVYIRGKVVNNIDGKTFTFASVPYFIDAHSTFFYDGKTFTFLASTNTVHVFTNDAASGGYVAIGNRLFFGTTTIEGGDPTTFHLYNTNNKTGLACKGCMYAADRNSVYYLGNKITVADPRTFALVDPKERSDGYGGSMSDEKRYAHDQSSVYYEGKPVPLADPKTFHIVGASYYDEFATDTSHAFFRGKVIYGADPKTFTLLTSQAKEGCSPAPYSRDATHVFIGTTTVSGADPETFMAFPEGRYGKDKNHVFEGDTMRMDLDVKTFQYSCEYG